MRHQHLLQMKVKSKQNVVPAAFLIVKNANIHILALQPHVNYVAWK